MMTSTSFNVGLADQPRLSSRVLRPPGGGHTDIFGGDPEPPRGRRHVSNITNIGQGDEPAKPTNGTVSPKENGDSNPSTPLQEQAESTPAPVTEANDSSVNKESPKAEISKTPLSDPGLIGAPKEECQSDGPKTEPHKEASKPEPQVEAPKMEPPKRVRVPPGGFSSGLW